MTTRCAAEVYLATGSRYGHWARCSRTGKHHEGGKDWCGIHAPSKVRDRDAAKRAKEDRASMAAARRQKIALMKGDLLGEILAMPFDELPERVKPIVAKIRNLEAKKP